MPSLYAPPALFFPGGEVGLESQFLQQNPDVAYQRWLDQLGIGPFSRLGQFLLQAYPVQQRRYESWAWQQPAPVTFLDYLGRHGQDLLREFRDLAPGLRGERQGALAGRVRWVGF